MLFSQFKNPKQKLKAVSDIAKNIPQIVKKTINNEVNYINEANSLNEKKLERVHKLIFFVNDLFLMIMILVLVSHFFSIGYVSGQSMEPTYHDGQHFVAFRKENYKPLEIVIFYLEDEEKTSHVFIKRVIATEGDTIYAKDGEIYVNDKILKEKYCKGKTNDFEKITLKRGEYFVIGDNREHSYDSRNIGVIKEESMIGKVVKVW